MQFHEVRFPASLSFGSLGGPERLTDVVTLANGFEERNTPWKHSRRRYDAGVAMRSLDDIETLIAFFEARQGQMYGFRWKDWIDFKSSRARVEPKFDDQILGLGDDVTVKVQLIKTYRSGESIYARPITKPVTGSVRVGQDGTELRDGAITEADIEAGRYDGAEVLAWLVNWQNVEERQLQFRGTIGEIKRAGGAFEAELRGLTEALNLPLGRVYQKPCSAVLGDAACGFDLSLPGYATECAVQGIEERRVFRFDALEGFAPEWFRHGALRVLDGPAKGLSGAIKRDLSETGGRVIELWHPFRAGVGPGDLVRLEAGCDKRTGTCRLKFSNLRNFQGFPDIPGDDWSITDPQRANLLDGGSRRT